MRLYNPNEIKAEDYDAEIQQTIEKLGNVLNPFMRQVYELSEGRIDFENMLSTIKNLEMTVDSEGVPTLNNKFQTGKSGIRGFYIINAQSKNDNTQTATAQPFIAKYTILGNGLVQIEKLVGLPAGVPFILTVITY